MTLTAKDTNAALRRHVTPLLKENGFDDATGRKFWRRTGDRTDHIEIAGYSAYRALTDNRTTASFLVWLGLSLPGYGHQNDPFHRDHIRTGPKGPRPSASQMPIRGALCPSDAPPLTKGRWGWEWQGTFDVRTIDEAETAALDLRAQLESYALDWLGRDWDLTQILAILERDETRLFLETQDNGSHLWLNAEMPQSQIRRAHITMVRQALGQGTAHRGNPAR